MCIRDSDKVKDSKKERKNEIWNNWYARVKDTEEYKQKQRETQKRHRERQKQKLEQLRLYEEKYLSLIHI